MHGRWKVTRYRLFSHTMSLGATRSRHDRVKRETDRVLPTKRKYLFSKRFRAYHEIMKSFRLVLYRVRSSIQYLER